MFFKIAAKTAGVMANYKQLEAIDSTPNYCDTSLTEKGKSYLRHLYPYNNRLFT